MENEIAHVGKEQDVEEVQKKDFLRVPDNLHVIYQRISRAPTVHLSKIANQIQKTNIFFENSIKRERITDRNSRK